MKKLLALVLALVMVLSLAACGGSKTTETTAPAAAEKPAETTAPAADEPATPIKIWFHGSNVTPEASDKVMAEVNAYLKDKLNVTIEPIWGTWGDFDTNVVTALAGGDDVDIYFTCNWSADEYNQYARDGYWWKLDDQLDTYAPELKALIPEGIWDCAKTNGMDGMGIYAVPALKDTATQNCWDVNGTLLAELGYDVDAICEEGIDFYSDKFVEMCKAAKELKGKDFYPIVVEPVVLERMVNHTAIVTGDLGAANVLSYYHDAEHPSKDIGSTIINKYSSPEFKKYSERVYELSQMGFISPQTQNVGTSNDYMVNCQKEANYLFGTQSYAFGYEHTASGIRGIDVRYVPETAPFMDCTSGQGAMMAIYAGSQHKELALQFLNLMNTDPVLMTMMDYGVEGLNYTSNDDGTISFVDDTHGGYWPWTNGMGNIRILPPTKEQGPTFQEEFAAFYNSAEPLPYKSFIFDNSEFSNEAAAITQVYTQYGFDLMSGAANPAEKLDKFLAELEGAGMDKFVAAANEQLEAYLAG